MPGGWQWRLALQQDTHGVSILCAHSCLSNRDFAHAVPEDLTDRRLWKEAGKDLYPFLATCSKSCTQFTNSAPCAHLPNFLDET